MTWMTKNLQTYLAYCFQRLLIKLCKNVTNQKYYIPFFKVFNCHVIAVIHLQ